MTTDDRPLFRSVDELENEDNASPTGALPGHETRNEDASLGAGVMATGGTATNTGTGVDATPGTTTRQDLETPLFGRQPTIGSTWADDAAGGHGEPDDPDRPDDALDR